MATRDDKNHDHDDAPRTSRKAEEPRDEPTATGSGRPVQKPARNAADSNPPRSKAESSIPSDSTIRDAAGTTVPGHLSPEFFQGPPPVPGAKPPQNVALNPKFGPAVGPRAIRPRESERKTPARIPPSGFVPADGSDIKPKDPNLKVRAVADGYFDHERKRPGDVFLLSDEGEFSERWMEQVDPGTPTRTTIGAEILRQQHQEIVDSRSPQGDRETPMAGVDETGGEDVL
jgi:hypothetical protein